MNHNDPIEIYEEGEELPINIEVEHSEKSKKPIKYLSLIIVGLVCFSLFGLINYFYYDTSPEKLSATKITPLSHDLSQSKYQKESWVLEEDMLALISKEPKAVPAWKVIQEIEHILSWSIGLRNLNKGDQITILWKHDISQISTDSTIQALVIEAAELDTILYAFRFSRNQQSQFYDWEGRPWQRQFLRSPVKYGLISSHYNLSRIHPLLKKVKAHKGTDFAAPKGAEVLALADGIIQKKTYGQLSGNFIKIKHGTIYSTAYLHLSAFAKGLGIGDSVLQGHVIGYVGSTGSSTAPHVCLRFYRRNFQDDFVGAFPYLPKPEPLPLTIQSSYQLRRDSLLYFMSD